MNYFFTWYEVLYLTLLEPGFWIFVALYTLVFVFPMVRGFRRGLDSARDPAHRATPASPWMFWWRGFWSSTRWWAALWLLLLVGLFLWGVLDSHWRRLDAGAIYYANAGLGLVVLCAATALLTAVGCLICAPRFRMLWPSIIGVLLITVALGVGCFYVLFEWVPGSWASINLARPQVSGGHVTLELTWVFFAGMCGLIGCAGLVGTWLRGRRWFRFEE
jgi:hypothetical protein